jgi:hypothetical protein
MKGSFSRASNNKKSVQCSFAAHGMGKQLKDCDGFTERWIKKMLKNVCAEQQQQQQKKPSCISGHHKRDVFMCDVSFPYALEVLYQIKSERFFMLMRPSNFIKNQAESVREHLSVVK